MLSDKHVKESCGRKSPKEVESSGINWICLTAKRSNYFHIICCFLPPVCAVFVIQIGVVKRLQKEVAAYEKEVITNEAKVQKMKDEGRDIYGMLMYYHLVIHLSDRFLIL